MKLELKHLKGYLDCGLKGAEYEGAPIFYLHSLSREKFLWKPFYTKGEINGRLLDRVDCKPILYPLSHLSKEIEHDGERFVPNDILNIDSGFTTQLLFLLDWEDVEKLHQWHFDIYGLIEAGQAIDKSTLNK